MEIIFKDSIIQKGERIKLPKAIVDTLELREGQGIIVKFDADKKRIIVEFEKRGRK